MDRYEKDVLELRQHARDRCEKRIAHYRTLWMESLATEEASGDAGSGPWASGLEVILHLFHNYILGQATQIWTH